MTTYTCLTFIVYVVYQGVTQSEAQPIHQSLGAHVDLPNQHGNTLPHPVIHRENNLRPQNASPSHHASIHVDLPNQHGNTLPHPVIHRENNHRPPSGPPSTHVGVHVDLPNQHGNTLPHPVIHRQHPGPSSNQHLAQPGEVHVEIPKQHPVVPRAPVDRFGHQGHGGGEVHVDLPFQHGNTRSHPVIHRTGGSSHSASAQQLPKSREFHHPGHQAGNGAEHAHVDHPGQHGNTAPFPVIHRPGITHQHNTGTTGGAGQHANLLPLLGISRNSIPGIDGARTFQSTGMQGQGMSSHTGHRHAQLGGASQFPFNPVTESREFGMQSGMAQTFPTQQQLGPPALNPNPFAPMAGGGTFAPFSMPGQTGGPMLQGAGMGGVQGDPMLSGMGMGMGMGMDMGMNMGMGGLGPLPLAGMGPMARMQFWADPVMQRRRRRRMFFLRRMRRLENMTELLQTTLAALLRRL